MSLLARIRKSCRHEEGESSNTGGAVPRNDVGIAPRQNAIRETMMELDGVDEETPRPPLLRFPYEETERGHEPAVGHARGGRQPAQLQQAWMLDDHAPLVPAGSSDIRSSPFPANVPASRAPMHAPAVIAASASVIAGIARSDGARLGERSP